MQFAKEADGIPLVTSDSNRDALFPSPALNQRVYNTATATIERYTGSGWVADISNVSATEIAALQASMNTATANANAAVAAANAATAAANAATAAAAASAGVAQGLIDASTPTSGGRTVTTLKSYLANNAYFNVKDFGAKGDGATDDSIAAQAAITAAITAGVQLRWPAGTYLITKSLNCTSASGMPFPFGMFGDGIGVTVITGILTEQYPIIDFSGNTRGSLKHMTVQATGSASKATAALLCAQTVAGGGAGNTVSVEDCQLYLPRTGNSYAVCGLVVFNADLSKFVRVEVQGPAGATMGWANPAGVSSKFQTLAAAGADSTIFDVHQCKFYGGSGAPFEYTGGAFISLVECYMSLLDDGAAGHIFKISTSGGGGCSVFARALRTENQSSATGVACVHWTTSSNQVVIDGLLETDSTGPLFKSDSGANLTNCNINVGSGAGGALFALTGGIAKARIMAYTSTNSFGAVGDLTNTFDVDVSGAITAASVKSAIGAVSGLRIGYSQLQYESMFKALFAPTYTGLALRPVGNFVNAAVSSLSYTASAEALIYTETLHGAAFQAWSASFPSTTAILEYIGNINASATGGRLRVNLIQGGGNIDILDTGANMPGAGNYGFFRLTVQLATLSGTSARAYCELVITDTHGNSKTFNQVVDIHGTVTMNADFSINFYATNTNNNPYALTWERACIA